MYYRRGRFSDSIARLLRGPWGRMVSICSTLQDCGKLRVELVNLKSALASYHAALHANGIEVPMEHAIGDLPPPPGEDMGSDQTSSVVELLKNL